MVEERFISTNSGERNKTWINQHPELVHLPHMGTTSPVDRHIKVNASFPPFYAVFEFYILLPRATCRDMKARPVNRKPPTGVL
jgi:hypothetical protein